MRLDFSEKSYRVRITAQTQKDKERISLLYRDLSRKNVCCELGVPGMLYISVFDNPTTRKETKETEEPSMESLKIGLAFERAKVEAFFKVILFYTNECERLGKTIKRLRKK